MKIYVAQIYPEAGADYPFSHRCQQYLSQLLTEHVTSTQPFAARYGDNVDLIVRMSAKTLIDEVQVLGPTVFRRDKTVEYTIFLPHSGDNKSVEALERVIAELLQAIKRVLGGLGFATDEFLHSDAVEGLAKRIVADPAMLTRS